MKKPLFLICAVLLVSAAAATGYKAYQNSRTPSLLDANIEALSQSEGGVATQYCYLDIAFHGTRIHTLFCDSSTNGNNDGYIYPCPQERYGYQSESCRDRCLK